MIPNYLPIQQIQCQDDGRPRTRCCAKLCPRWAQYKLTWVPPDTDHPGCRARTFDLCKVHLRQFFDSKLTFEPYSPERRS